MIAHDHLSATGLLTAGLDDAGFEVSTLLVVPADRHQTPDVVADFPQLDGFDLVIALGAPWSVYDNQRIGTWLVEEKTLLRAADDAGIPVLGVCFGGQLLASVHGGTVRRSPAGETGWHTVQTDDPALIPSGDWFQWHFDSWSVPGGAREVARTSEASQAFVLRRNLAVQFHPELDAGILRGWLANGAAEVAIARGHDPERLLEQTRLRQAVAEQQATDLIDNFLNRVAFADR